MVELKNINKSFSEKKLFFDFNLTFESGKITCVLGASGSGKTTLLNIIAGLTEFQGSCLKDGGDISYIFQKDRLIPRVSVYKNLDLSIKSKIKDKTERKKAIADILKRVELPDTINDIPQELSGGEQQRISMARGFLFPAEILLMDEPFKELDIALKSRLVKLFCSLYDAFPRTVVFVTHDIYEALLLADRIIVISGAPAKIVLDEKIELPRAERDAFGTELDVIKKQLAKALAG
ncbi:MAG TPA: ABC transporter ATP-binding protein [Eubacteriales bacterium]|nr:ABC transporter ATP-binding protein [Clostridia bacterium]HRR89172.1 ABC transporter ATP-binding protein [Eubacteriales bacterium]HRU84692.1 ABC transporter ATP-binding protein [Eubacteriales bacterium]